MSPPKRIGTVYSGILRRPPRHRRPWRYEKTLALKSLVLSLTAASIYFALALYFIRSRHPVAWWWIALTLVWSSLSFFRVRKYKEERR